MRVIAQRELRNQISGVLREVEAGGRLRITVDGRPVADLVPIVGARAAFVPREALEGLLARAPLDPAFGRDVEALTGASIEEL